mmetsp:Transcript_9600/g.14176  ORF Transcript_9600/g.14176 Transcript_9600/m.14176 type:complete len:203 (+) Transcript_9600:1-609(+)
MVSMKGYTIITPFQSDSVHPRHSVVFEDMKMAAVNYDDVLRHVGVAEFDDSYDPTPKILERFKHACFHRFLEHDPHKKTSLTNQTFKGLEILEELQQEKQRDYIQKEFNPLQGTFPPDNGTEISSSSRIWVGKRPIVGDDICVIGRSDRVQNLYLNTGHAGAGWCLSFGSGKLLSDLILHNKTNLPIDHLELLSPDRFQKNE